jgi:hypothetical protein
VPRFWFTDNVALQQFLTNELVYGLQVAVEAATLATINGTSENHDAGLQHIGVSDAEEIADRAGISGLHTGVHAVESRRLGRRGARPGVHQRIEHPSLPYDAGARRLFGTPVVISTSQALGVSHTVGAGAVGLDVDQQGVQVAWSETSNADG